MNFPKKKIPFFQTPQILFYFILSCLIGIHAFPYFANYKYLIALANSDDDIYTYYIISRYFERFHNDILGYQLGKNVLGSILNYGSLFLANYLHISILWIHHFLTFFQLFALPLSILFVLTKHKNIKLSRTELLFGLIFMLLSGYSCWNFGNFTEISVPYAGILVLPFLWLGLCFISEEKPASSSEWMAL